MACMHTKRGYTTSGYKISGYTIPARANTLSLGSAVGETQGPIGLGVVSVDAGQNSLTPHLLGQNIGVLGINDRAASSDQDEASNRVATVGRMLTSGELALASFVFGDAIDYKKVTIYHKKYFLFQPEDVAMAPNGSIYFHPTGQLYSHDYSFEKVSLQGLLIHELTHVWQHQRGVNVAIRGIYDREYEYTLEKGKALTEYGIEQQGDIVQDYFMVYRGKKRKYSLLEYQAVVPF